MAKRVAAAVLALLVSPHAGAADKEEICARSEQLIESSLKVLATVGEQQFLSDEFDAFIEKTRPKTALNTAIMLNAWGQVHASIAHMQALGCKPYARAIDPSVYRKNAEQCSVDKSKGAPACKRGTWRRSDAAEGE